MRKIVCLVLTSIMLISLSTALAEDLGIQAISIPIDPNSSNTISLDDIQLGTSYTLDAYAIVTPRELKTVDCFAQFGESGKFDVYQRNYSSHIDSSYSPVYSYSSSKFEERSWRYTDASWMDSGDSADFIWLLTDITNFQKVPVDFTEKASVKVVYQDEYEFTGWIRQIVYDHMEAQNGNKMVSRYGYDANTYPTEIVMNPNNTEAIDMLYTGTYVLGCTLPNYVLSDKNSSLRIEIDLEGNELTYNIRK